MVNTIDRMKKRERRKSVGKNLKLLLNIVKNGKTKRRAIIMKKIEEITHSFSFKGKVNNFLSIITSNEFLGII
jgi:hypothetical protein